MKTNKPLEERFWDKVDKKSDDECWLWKGFLNWGNYGMFRVGDKVMLAHRYSYMIHRDNYREVLDVLHSCDNRNCVNPQHLYQGTDWHNAHDRMVRGKNNFAKLKEKEVLEIRRLSDFGISGRKLAKIFNVSKGTIYRIKNRQSWTWI
ncbi:MAG: helix-turn-helix domain-containing protein [Candidatus Hodarchaeota archaeon]